MKIPYKVLTFSAAVALFLSACGGQESGSSEAEKKAATEKTELTEKAASKEKVLPTPTGTAYVAPDVLEENKKIQSMTAEELEEAYKKEPASKRAININVSGSYCTSGPALAAIMGYFDEEGLKYELVKTPNMIDALATGKIDIGVTHVAHILKPTTNGLNVAYLGGANTSCQSVYVPIDSPVETLDDLKGQIIGVSGGIGGSGHNIFMTMLAADNLKGPDYKFLDFEATQLIAASETGEVAGFIVQEQLGEMWVEQGKVKRIRSITYDDDFKNDICCVWMTNGTFREENPVTAYKLTRAINKAKQLMEEDTPGTVKTMMDEGWVAGDQEYNTRLAIPWNMNPTLKEAERTFIKNIEAYKEMGIIDKNLDTVEFMNKHWKPFDI